MSADDRLHTKPNPFWREMPTGRIVLTIETVIPMVLVEDLRAWLTAHRDVMVFYDLTATPVPLTDYLTHDTEGSEEQG